MQNGGNLNLKDWSSEERHTDTYSRSLISYSEVLKQACRPSILHFAFASGRMKREA